MSPNNILRLVLAVGSSLSFAGCCSTKLSATFTNDALDQPPPAALGANRIEYADGTDTVRVVEATGGKAVRHQCPSEVQDGYLRFVSTPGLSKEEISAEWDAQFPELGDQTTLQVRLKDLLGDIGRTGAEVNISGAGENRVTVRAGAREETVTLTPGVPVHLEFAYNQRTKSYTFAMEHAGGRILINAGAAPDAETVDFANGAKLEFWFERGCADGAAHLVDNVTIRECTKVRLGGGG